MSVEIVTMEDNYILMEAIAPLHTLIPSHIHLQKKINNSLHAYKLLSELVQDS